MPLEMNALVLRFSYLRLEYEANKTETAFTDLSLLLLSLPTT